MATIDIDFPTFLLSEVVPQRDKLNYVFRRGQANEFSNPIGSLRGPDFPISAQGRSFQNRFLLQC